MKYQLLIFLSFIPILNFAQVNYTNEAKKDLRVQDSILRQYYNNFITSKDSLETLTKKLSPKITEYYEIVTSLKKETDSLFSIAKTSLLFYKQKGVQEKTLDSIISLPEKYSIGIEEEEKKEEEEEEETIYLYFGGKKLISKDRIIKDSIANEVLTNVFLEDSETHFGNFWFPKDKQLIPLYRNSCVKNKSLQKKPCDEMKTLRFKEITIDLYEGSIRDIKVFLTGENGKVYVFENSVGISLLKFNELSGRNYLKNTSIQTDKNGKSEYIDYRLRVSDVLRYFHQPNGNHVPNNISFTFPIETINGKTNKNSANIYELRQSTSLNNVIDFRAYTDVLGLINQSDNGITNVSGQADFFVMPFRLDTYFGNFFLLKKIKPYISYSRFDDNDKFLELKDGEILGNKALETRIENLKKSYLDIGVKLFLLNFKISKELPFETGLYGSARYQLARINLDSGSDNYKTMGVGAGINFEFMRFENLSLNYSLEFSNYNQDSYNDIQIIEDSSNFWVMRNEAEFAYYPSKKKDNTIFLKVITFDDIENGIDSNFIQFQFGYKFVLGAGKVKLN